MIRKKKEGLETGFDLNSVLLPTEGGIWDGNPAATTTAATTATATTTATTIASTTSTTTTSATTTF